jgi:hypothetical protein
MVTDGASIPVADQVLAGDPPVVEADDDDDDVDEEELNEQRESCELLRLRPLGG